MKTLKPAGVFHPGEYLKEELEARELSAEKFSQMTGIPLDDLNRFLDCKVQILGWWAERIGRHLQTSAILCLNLNHAYYDHKRKNKAGDPPAANGAA